MAMQPLTPLTPLHTAAALTLGDVGAGASLGPYELLAPVAQGGMASVWAARRRGPSGFQKLVALKAMLPELGHDARFEEMFLAEARFASRIEHPNVCSVLDLGEHGTTLFIAMEWVEGETLSALCRAVRASDAVTLGGRRPPSPGRIPLPIAARIVHDAALGLHAAHELRGDGGEAVGLVHCDVSPQNVMITGDGVTKLVDFGVAKAAEASPAQAGLIRGKASFMAPEQAAGGPVDRRTDVFALGVLAYELVTGVHPFRGETADVTFGRLRDGAGFAPPNVAWPDCPPLLAEAIARAVEKAPTRRFQTMLELAHALERAVPLARHEDVGAFLRGMLGERTDARRAAIREAMRVADARAAGPSDGRSSVGGSLHPVEMPCEEVAHPEAPARSRPLFAPLAIALALASVIGLLALRSGLRPTESRAPAVQAAIVEAPVADVQAPPPAAAEPVAPAAPPPTVTADAPSAAVSAAPPKRGAVPSKRAATPASRPPSQTGVVLPSVRDPGF